MKLQDLAAPQKTKQVAKVMESHFGKSIAFESISKRQAHEMLNRVRGLISEHRRQPEFHSSEQNPAYLKLVMMEQALASRISEQDVVAGQTTVPAGQTPQQAAALQAQQQVQKRKQIQDQMRELDQAHTKQKQELQKQLAMAESQHSLRRKLKESEVQQAQVVLAAQDMVDKMQSMLEDTTEMQFKELPALVDSIRNQIGMDQAMQFNTDASAALAGLVQNLQGAKLQLEQALGVVTGTAQPTPALDAAMAGGEPAADVGAELGAEVGADIDADIDAEELPAEEPEGPAAGGKGALGRARR
jgi:hypothetical protein